MPHCMFSHVMAQFNSFTTSGVQKVEMMQSELHVNSSRHEGLDGV